MKYKVYFMDMAAHTWIETWEIFGRGITGREIRDVIKDALFFAGYTGSRCIEAQVIPWSPCSTPVIVRVVTAGDTRSLYMGHAGQMCCRLRSWKIEPEQEVIL